MSRALTDATVRSIQAPSTGRLEVSDPGCRGLELRITSTGAKTFAFRFRDRHSKRVRAHHHWTVPGRDAARRPNSRR